MTSGCAPRTDPQSTAATLAAAPVTLRRAAGAEPESLDPARADDNAALAILGDLYEGLTTLAADGTIVPGAATRWEVTPDGRRWTFYLRQGLRWSSGAPLSAAQFAAALDTVRQPASTSPYADLLSPVTAVLAPDDLTVVIETRQPLRQLPALLAMPFASPRTEEVTDASNGPYRLVSREPGVALQLERNPYFHAASRVSIERVTYLTLEDLNTELKLYRADELDLTSEVPNAQIGWLQQHLPHELHIAPYLSTYAYAVNLRRLGERDARLALALAIDRMRITGQVTGAGELAAYGWVPPGIAGYAPARFTWREQSRDTQLRDAQALWHTAVRRGSAPSRLRLCTDVSANHHRTAVAVADFWRSALGVETEIVEMEWQSYLERREHPGDCDLLRFGWSGDYADPAAFLSLFATGHPQNVPGYASADYDAALAAAAAATDPAVRFDTLRAAEQRLLDEVIVIPIFHRVSKRLVKPHVAGVVANPLGHLPTRYLSLQRDKK
jgi:oligopeptide transport system substrate-binding protein